MTGKRHLGIARKLRRAHWHDPLVRELERLGCEDCRVEKPTGKGHPKMVWTKGGRPFRMTVPSTGGGHVSPAYLIAEARRILRDAP